MGVCNPDRGWPRPHLHRFRLPHEAPREQPGLCFQGEQSFPQNVLLTTYFLFSQKDEQPEEEKPLTLSNGMTTGEPASENGKAQNGHIILSPPVNMMLIFTSHFHSVQSSFSWH